jgi:hypothetical protein
MKPKWVVDSYLALRLAQLLLAQKRKSEEAMSNWKPSEAGAATLCGAQYFGVNRPCVREMRASWSASCGASRGRSTDLAYNFSHRSARNYFYSGL